MNKKLLALFLACFLPVALLAGSGDANGDGKINLTDVMTVLNTKKATKQTDINSDGKVTKEDADIIVDHLVKGDVL